jgi:hypothetical protein
MTVIVHSLANVASVSGAGFFNIPPSLSVAANPA